MTTDDVPQYRIRAVARRTGIAAVTLRAWERRYGVPRPARTDSAYRTYSERDIEVIEQLRRLCDSGMSPAEAAKLVRADIDRGVERTALQLESSPLGGVGPDVASASVRRLLAAVEACDVTRLELELVQVRGVGAGKSVFSEVLRPALVGVGEMWHAGAISVGHEHIASEAILATARELLQLAQPTQPAKVALLACFADELHAGPLFGVGLQLVSLGCRVVVLGAMTPPAALAAAARALDPAVIGLSVTVPPSDERARALVAGYAAACRAVPWVVGGQGAASLAATVGHWNGHVAPSREAETDHLFERLLTGSAQSSAQTDRRRE